MFYVVDSLRPIVKKSNPWIPFYYAGAAVGVFICIWFVVRLLLKKRARYGYIFYPQSNNYFKISNHYFISNFLFFIIASSSSIAVISSNHPLYTPTIDKIKNSFLPLGHCVICKNMKVRVVQLKKCSHGICIEDLEGYLESALGDISMFPVKCPLFFEGCSGCIDAVIAKRFLSELNYKRFLDFSDRATFGDGNNSTISHIAIHFDYYKACDVFFVMGLLIFRVIWQVLLELNVHTVRENFAYAAKKLGIMVHAVLLILLMTL
jgi:hypothetical protein